MEDKFKLIDVARHLLPPPGAEAVGVCIDKIREQSKSIEDALEVIFRFGSIDGDQHKTWVIDQVTRKLTGDKYEEYVKEAKAGVDGPDTYIWDKGIAP